MFGFPDQINDRSARLVAAGVITMCVAFLVTREPLIVAALSYGFIARVVAGPRFSPLALLVTRVIQPALGGGTMVAGSPKRFAQGIGATLSTAALIALVAGSTTTAIVLTAMILGAASLEAAFGLCLGCHAYRLLIQGGVLDEEDCPDCADITQRTASVS